VDVGEYDASFEHEYALDQACKPRGTFKMSDLRLLSASVSCP
jgi:hypothetical protein